MMKKKRTASGGCRQKDWLTFIPGFGCNPGCSTRQISGGRSAIGSQTLVPDLICYDYDSYGNIKKYRTEANR